MASPIGSPNNQGNGDQQFKAWVRQMIRDEIANANRGGVGINVDGATGDLVATDGKKVRSGNYVPGTSGWGLQPNGNAEFNDLTLRGGIIGNDALTHPLSFDGAGGLVTNFAVTTTQTTLGTVTRTVPAGMTKMASFVWGETYAINSGASLDYLFVNVGIAQGANNYVGNAIPQPASGSNGSCAVSAAKYGILTGLTAGQTVDHYIQVKSNGANWAASTSNRADIQVMIIWGA